jgi:hypothetical protein
MKKIGFLLFTSVLALCGTTVIVHADKIAFEVRGSVIGFDGPALPPFEIGQTYVATYVFDSGAVGSSVFGGGKDYIGAVIAGSFRIGDYTGNFGDSAATNIRVLDNHFGHTDEYLVTVSDISAPPVQTPAGLITPTLLAVVDLFAQNPFGNPTALLSDELPLVPPNIPGFEGSSWKLTIDSQAFFASVRGKVDSLIQVPVNEPPDCGRAVGNPNVIWPPNHKMVPISVLVTDPNDDPIINTVTGFTQDEPVSGPRYGNTAPDAWVGPYDPMVRAERSGVENGRVYFIYFTAADDKGGTCEGAIRVCVPHNPGSPCIDDGQNYDSTLER